MPRFWRGAWLLIVVAACAEAPEPRPAIDVGQAAQQLVDEFIGVMPPSPTELRKAAVRAELAPRALPILARVRAFVAEHPDCPLAARVHEFTVFALVLGEPGLREALEVRRGGGDAGAAALLGAADTILAVEPGPREAAVGRFATSLREPVAAAGSGPVSTAAACAVFCASIAADLSAEEAARLAESATDPALGMRLRQLEELAQNDPRLRVGQPIELTGRLFDGTPFTTRSLRGKVVVVDFWATWCGPCRRAMPELVRLREAHAADGLAVLGVDCGSPRADLAAFLTEHPEVDWPQLYADGEWHPIATEFGIDRIPRVFVIDRHGALRSVDAGADLDATVRGYLQP